MTTQKPASKVAQLLILPAPTAPRSSRQFESIVHQADSEAADSGPVAP